MTEREKRFLHALCVCVRAFTLDQAMRYLRFGDTSNFGKFVRPLIERDLVRTCRAFAKPVPVLSKPLLVWSPGSGFIESAKGAVESSVRLEDGFTECLRLARARWAGLSASSVCCYVATRRAGMLYGVHRTGSLRQPLQATHDLCVSEVFLVVEAHKREGEDWHGEDLSDYRLAGKVPDAVIRNPEGFTQKVIEVVGADYEEAKLIGIHNECNVRSVLYELW